MKKEFELPEAITKDLYITLGLGDYNNGDISISDIDRAKYTSEGFESVLLVKTSISVEIPKDIDVKAKLIAVLEKQKSGIQAEYHIKLTNVQDKIDNLLAIEHKPT